MFGAEGIDAVAAAAPHPDWSAAPAPLHPCVHALTHAGIAESAMQADILCVVEHTLFNLMPAWLMEAPCLPPAAPPMTVCEDCASPPPPPLLPANFWCRRGRGTPASIRMRADIELEGSEYRGKRSSRAALYGEDEEEEDDDDDGEEGSDDDMSGDVVTDEVRVECRPRR